MALTSDTFIERSQLKRQLTFWRLVAVGVIIFFLIIFFERSGQISTVSVADKYVARLTIQGTISEDPELYKLLDDVKVDDAVEAVILYLDTPGGVAAGGETIYRKVKAISEVKPVVVSMRSVCASAGYMISLAADHVLAMRSTITGSIGVIIQSAEMSRLADKVGITPVVVRSGRFKGTPSVTNPITDEERQVVQTMIDEFHDVFVDMVAGARGLPKDTVKEIADGRVYSAMRALELDLIDGLGGEPEALAWLIENKDIDPAIEVRDVEVKTDFDKVIERLSQSAGISSIANSYGLDNGLLLIWKPQF